MVYISDNRLLNNGGFMISKNTALYALTLLSACSADAMMQRAWNQVRQHPIITTAVLACGAAGTVYAVRARQQVLPDPVQQAPTNAQQPEQEQSIAPDSPVIVPAIASVIKQDQTTPTAAEVSVPVVPAKLLHPNRVVECRVREVVNQSFYRYIDWPCNDRLPAEIFYEINNQIRIDRERHYPVDKIYMKTASGQEIELVSTLWILMKISNLYDDCLRGASSESQRLLDIMTGMTVWGTLNFNFWVFKKDYEQFCNSPTSVFFAKSHESNDRLKPFFNALAKNSVVAASDAASTAE